MCPQLKEELKLSEKECLNLLNDALRKYFVDVTTTLALLMKPSAFRSYTGSEEYFGHIFTIDMQKLFHELKPDTLCRDELKFFKRNNIKGLNDHYIKGVSTNVCYYCKIADFYDKDFDRDISITDEAKLKNKYSKCCSKFGRNSTMSDVGGDSSPSDLFKLDADFCKKYSRIKYFGLRDTILDTENQLDKLKHVVDIQLDNNRLTQLPETILKLKSLVSLSIKNNPISEIHNKEVFLSFKSLETLEVENLRLTLKPGEIFDLPATMKNLIVRNFASTFVPFNFEKCKESLTTLTYSGVAWIDTSPYAPYKLWIITKEHFMNRFDKFFNKDHLLSLFRYFDASKENSLNPQEVTNLNAFIFKRFERIGDDFPSVIFSLTHLTRLDLSYQSIKTVPDGIENLKSLNKLYLTNCILLDNISPKISNLPLQKLVLTGCISLKTPPPEIVNRGLVSILSFLKRLLFGSVLCKKTKLMLVT